MSSQSAEQITTRSRRSRVMGVLFSGALVGLLAWMRWTEDSPGARVRWTQSLGATGAFFLLYTSAVVVGDLRGMVRALLNGMLVGTVVMVVLVAVLAIDLGPIAEHGMNMRTFRDSLAVGLPAGAIAGAALGYLAYLRA